jgi:hypothetical protein
VTAADEDVATDESHHHHAAEFSEQRAPLPATSHLSAVQTCCPNCDVTPLVSIAAVRTDAGLWLAAPASAPEGLFRAELPARIAVVEGRLTSLQAIARTPPVLRI